MVIRQIHGTQIYKSLPLRTSLWYLLQAPRILVDQVLGSEQKGARMAYSCFQIFRLTVMVDEQLASTLLPVKHEAKWKNNLHLILVLVRTSYVVKSTLESLSS